MRLEVLDMAKEAGCTLQSQPEYSHDVVVFTTPESLDKFARLIEKRKGEELAVKMSMMPFGDTAQSIARWLRDES